MSDYSDILNRKKTSDNLGDAFSRQADSMRPLNVGQRREQALLRGLGVGLNNNDEREAKIAELEEQYKQIDGLNRQLRQTAGENQLKEQKIKSFIMDQDSNLKLASDLIVKGKYDQLDILAPSIVSAYKKHTGTDLGEFLFSKNGHFAFRQPDGKIETTEAKILLNPVLNYIPVENRGDYRGFTTSYQAEELDAIVEARKLKNQSMESQIESNSASADLHRSQAEQIRQATKNPPISKQEQLLFKVNVDNNHQYLKEERKKIISDKILVQTLNEVEEMLLEASKKGQVGSTILPLIKRNYSKYLSGDNKEITIVDMIKAAYFHRVKEAGGSNPSTTEFLTALETVPNSDKNLLASLNILKRDKNNALKNIYRFNNIEKNLRENQYQGSPDDESIINFNEDEFNKFINENSSKNTISLSKKDKKTGKWMNATVPIDDAKELLDDGFKIIGR